MPSFAKVSIAVAGSLLLSATPAYPLATSPQPLDAIEGRWTGSMTLGVSEYPINIWFKNGKDASRFQYIGKSSANNTLDNVVLAGNRVSFKLRSAPPMKFDGAIRGKQLAGSIQIGPVSGSFSVQCAK